MGQEKERIDKLLVEKGFFDSREKAQAALMAGVVFASGSRVDKAGQMVDVQSEIEVKGKILPYVSRGGLKIEKAIKSFKIDIKGKVAADIGASTGGFTDCLLQNGAKKVYAVDVGYGQLAWELRNDERVVCMERINARYLKPEDFPDVIDIVSIDVSFISLKLILPAVKNILAPDGEIICLVKPQFEAGREKVGKKGVVRDPEVHYEVLEEIIKFVIAAGMDVRGIDHSPVKGPEGNIEYLLYARNSRSDNDADAYKREIREIVDISHSYLSTI